MNTTVIFLFDLDGVLIKPGGYRKAVNATLSDLQKWCGFTANNLTEADLLLFEAAGITNEWDMIALTLAAWLETAAAAGVEIQAEEYAQLRGAVQVSTALEMDYRYWIGQFSERLIPGLTPPRGVLAGEEGGSRLFPHLPANLLSSLLAGTDNFSTNPLSMLQENYVLGSETFARYYCRPALRDTPSFLQQEDRPLIRPSVRDQLLSLHSSGKVRLAVMTARQTLPDSWEELPPGTCFPEGEMALDLLGMNALPLIGYGHLLEAADRFGEPVDSWIKPAARHALACCLSALGIPDPILAARDLTLGKPRSLPEKISLHIFEDARVGLLSGMEAAQVLRSSGSSVTVHLWGIATSPEKDAALVDVGAKVFADINAALETGLKFIPPID